MPGRSKRRGSTCFIGSVGIALALFGSFFLAYASLNAGLESTLLFDQLIKDAPHLSRPWLHAAFVLLFVGYGTKMGLAPMHTWKPDAYGEAPGIVGALLAGGITSCAFLAILRVYQICRAGPTANSPVRSWSSSGLFSMAVAAVFMVRQRDFKRMLAYSSVEHMGILVLGIGLGGVAVYGALLHLINNGLTKGVLFLSAGNIHRAYGSKVTDEVRGAYRRVPALGGPVPGRLPRDHGLATVRPVRERVHDRSTAAIGSGQYVAGGLFLLLLGVVFIGMGAHGPGRGPGEPRRSLGGRTRFHDSLGTGLPDAPFHGPRAAARPLRSRLLWIRSCARPRRPWRRSDERNACSRPSGQVRRSLGGASPGCRSRSCAGPSWRLSPVGSGSPRSSATSPRRVAKSIFTPSSPTETARSSASAMTTLESDRFPSMTPDCPQVHLFEREIAEQYGVRPDGHPWFKPVRFHASYRPGHDAWGQADRASRRSSASPTFIRVEGEEIHEVAVGPVHAGVIEPGHFRFQCHGEEVFHLEISLGYQHRGIERVAGRRPGQADDPPDREGGRRHLGRPRDRLLPGGRGAGRRPSRRSGRRSLRGIALELERLANHTGRPGRPGRRRGVLADRVLLRAPPGRLPQPDRPDLCGSRFGRAWSGRAGSDSTWTPAGSCSSSSGSTRRSGTSTGAADLLWNSLSVQARFEGTGTVSPETAVALGLVGPAARACGLEGDVRHDFPAGIFRFAQVPVSSWTTGDVFARGYVRWLEIQRSVAFIKDQLQRVARRPVPARRRRR